MPDFAGGAAVSVLTGAELGSTATLGDEVAAGASAGVPDALGDVAVEIVAPADTDVVAETLGDGDGEGARAGFALPLDFGIRAGLGGAVAFGGVAGAVEGDGDVAG